MLERNDRYNRFLFKKLWKCIFRKRYTNFFEICKYIIYLYRNGYIWVRDIFLNCDKEGITLLISAICYNDIQFINVIIAVSKRLKISIASMVSIKKYSPLRYAIVVGNPSIVKRIISNMDNISIGDLQRSIDFISFDNNHNILHRLDNNISIDDLQRSIDFISFNRISVNLTKRYLIFLMLRSRYLIQES